MKSLTTREQRIVAIGILIALIAVLQLGVVGPLVAGFSERAALGEQLRAQYARNERDIARIATLRRTAEKVRRDQAQYTLAAPNAEAGGDILKDRMEKALATVGGTLKSSEVVDTQRGWARATLDGELTYPQLVQLLQILRNSSPYLVTESLSISADRALNTGQLETMDLKIETSIPLTK